MKLIPYNLSDNAEEAVKEVLENGKSLASALLQHNDLFSGTVETYLPENVTEKQVNNFTHGGIFPSYPSEYPPCYDGKGTLLYYTSFDSSEDQLIAYVNSYLKSNPLSFAVFENPIVEPHFPWLKTPVRQSRILLHEKEVINCMTADEATIDLASNLMGEIGGLIPWPGLIGAIVHGDKDMIRRWKNDFGSVSKKDLEEVASYTEKIIIGVYDGESYLMCSKLHS